MPLPGPTRDARMVRVLIVDDHPAVRRGLLSILRREPGFAAVSACASAGEALSESARWDPDVALIDYELPDGDGLALTHQLRQSPDGPRVVLYTAFAAPRLCLAAALAGVDGLVDKSQPVEAIFDALRAVARGGVWLEQVTPDALRAGAALLDPEDHALVGLALAREPVHEIARVLGREPSEIALRLQRMIERLRSRSFEMRPGSSPGVRAQGWSPLETVRIERDARH